MRAFLRGRMARWIRLRQGPDLVPVTLARRRLYILPTRAGVGFGFLLLLMLLAGLNYANSSALFLAFALMAFTLVAMHQCHRNLLGTTLLAAKGHPTFARTDGRLELVFASETHTARYRVAARVEGGALVTRDIVGQDTPLELPIPAPTRGVLRVDRFLLVTTHPYGLFRTWTWIHTPVELVVYPRASGSLPMPAISGDRANQLSRTAVGSDEWLGLRPFRDGDSPRQVDWKAYARDAPLLVKEYSALGSELRLFDFETLRALNLEARLEQLARWVVDAEAGGASYGLNLPGARIEPDRGPEHRHRCLASLASYGHKPVQLRAQAH